MNNKQRTHTLFSHSGGATTKRRGVAGQRPAEGEVEKPKALERGGDFPLWIKKTKLTIMVFDLSYCI
jgi:hypothetical protein